MPRKLETAEISFGLVTVQVGVYSAIDEQDIHNILYITPQKRSQDWPLWRLTKANSASLAGENPLRQD